MKRLVSSILIALSLVVVAGPTAFAAEKKKKKSEAAAAAAAKPALAGKYTGEWKGKEDSSGALRISFKQDDAGAWSAEAAFTFEGNEVPVKTKSLKVEGEKVEVVFEWSIQGTNGQSKLTGELKGNKLEGKYDSNVAEAASSGTWSLTRA
jgi:hypothetical protein